MEYAEHVDAVGAAADAFADALRGASMTERVPSCPAWTLADLAGHVRDFTGFWTHVLCEGAGRPKTPFDALAADADGDAAAAHYADLGGYLVGELRAVSADSPAWTWAKDHQNAGFIARRVAHELTVHRFDAQLARADPQPIRADMAADGIEEIFSMIEAWGPPAGKGEGQTLHIHGTDRGDEWMIAMTPDGMTVDRSHAKADMAFRGAVCDLELVLYQRPPIGDVERFGDEGALAAWRAAFTFE